MQLSKVRLVGFLKIVLFFVDFLKIIQLCLLLLLRSSPTVAAAYDPDKATYTGNQDGNEEDAEHQSRVC